MGEPAEPGAGSSAGGGAQLHARGGTVSVAVGRRLV